MRVINTTAFVFALVATLGYYFFSVRKWKAQNDKIVVPTKGYEKHVAVGKTEQNNME